MKTPSVDSVKRKLITSPSLDSHFNPTNAKKLSRSPIIQSLKRSKIHDRPDPKKVIETNKDVFTKLMNKDKNEDIKKKQNLLGAFGKKPEKTSKNNIVNQVIEEQSEKTKHDSYTYDLDEVLKNSDIKNSLHPTSKGETKKKETNIDYDKDNNKEFNNFDVKTVNNDLITPETKISNITKHTSEIKSKSMQNIERKFEQENNSFNDLGGDDDIKLDLGVKRKHRHDLNEFVNNFSSFSHIGKSGMELSILKKYQGEDQDILPAFKHSRKRNDSFKKM